MKTTAKQPGRLGNPDLDLRTDPRTNPRMLAVLATYGLDARAASAPISRKQPLAEVMAFVAQADAGFEGLYEALPNDLPGDDINVTHTKETIRGVDGNDILLHIYRPANGKGPMPCTVYIHGGGMVILKTHNKVHHRWCESLAATGMVVIAIDFRNAYTAAGTNPFPAGLDDCSSGLAWIHAHRKELGITKVVVQGESGGANLTIATTLKAKRDGTLGSIDGVYAMVPYVSGGYGWDDERKLRELPSLVENDGYFLNNTMMDLLVVAYDPTNKHAENPLAWPYFASAADLKGLPPHVVSANELDPLRDEGMDYYRKLVHAGVTATGRVNLGIVHGADSIFRQALPEVYRSTVADIKRFASSL